MTLAVLSDIHSRRINEFLPIIEKRRPDFIVIPGDLVDGAKIRKARQHKNFIEDAIILLNRISRIAPTYYSIGNHEKHFIENEIEELYRSEAVVLQERYTRIADGLLIGGLSSGRNFHDKSDTQTPEIRFIDEFEKLLGYKILLSHHPEYYEPYLKNKDIDLIISGHAHGGQIRLINHGLFAPGQGLLPKYTSGIYDEKLIVSRGIAGTELIPRINNSPEIVYLRI